MTDNATQVTALPVNGTSQPNGRNDNIPAESQSPPSTAQQNSSTGHSPKKRRKVNHGMCWESDSSRFLCFVGSGHNWGLSSGSMCILSKVTHDLRWRLGTTSPFTICRSLTRLLERPCGRCLKRNIGHLCHDEPREPKKPKQEALHGDGHEDHKLPILNPANKTTVSDILTTAEQTAEQTQASLGPPSMPPPRKLGPAIVSPSPVSLAPRQALNSNSQGCE